MRLTRKKAAILASTLVLLAIAAAIAVVVIGNMRETAIEQKIGDLLKAKINATLVPQLEFEGIDYQQPKTLILRDVRLVSPDPDAPSQTITIFHADFVRIELGEVPRKGQPLVFESLTLERPTVRLVWPQSGGGAVGFSDLIAPQRGSNAIKVSTALRMNLVALQDATLVIDTRLPGTQPTVIDQITTDVHIDPAQGGQYHLALDLDREPRVERTYRCSARCR